MRVAQNTFSLLKCWVLSTGFFWGIRHSYIQIKIQNDLGSNQKLFVDDTISIANIFELQVEFIGKMDNFLRLDDQEYIEDLIDQYNLAG
jgi:hypothetical protein